MDSMQRTPKQNRSIHVLAREISETLNNSGLDVRAVMKENIEIPWDMNLVKKLLIHPIIKIKWGYDSTKQLTTKQVNEVYDIIVKHLGEKFHFFVDFPSNERE